MTETVIKAILQKVLKDVVPTGTEKKKLESIINFTKNKITKALSDKKVNAEVIVGGSVAKGTWLHDNHDVDFFVKFNLKYKDGEIGKILSNVLKSAFGKLEVVHGTRDYYHIYLKGFKLEIVPVLAIKDPKDAKNSMDASSFHIDYIKKKIFANPNLADEIRLLKTFAYAQNAYGAETQVAGFSGYVLELLTCYYGSFNKLMAEWDKKKPKIYIDMERRFKDVSEINKTLSTSKTVSPIILIDPVLKERNACAALDDKTFAKMLFALRMFKRKPSIEYFKIKPSTIKKDSKKRGTILVEYKLKNDNDVYLSKIKSRLEDVVRKLNREKILVYSYGVTDKNAFVEVETLKLSSYRKHMGPNIWIGPEYFDKFIRKWPNAYVYDTSIVVDVKRSFSDIRQFVSKILKESLGNI